MPAFARRLATAALLCTLAACTNGGDPKESGNMTGGSKTAGGTGSPDTAGSTVAPSAQPVTVPTGAGSDTGPKPACCSAQKADTSKKAP